MMEKQRCNVRLRSGRQAMHSTGTTIIAITGLAGFALARARPALPFLLATGATLWLVWQRRASKQPPIVSVP